MELSHVRDHYSQFARRWLKDGDESCLASAYDLGTKAHQGGVRLSELLALHHELIERELSGDIGEGADRAARAGALLGELLSPYELELARMQDFQSSLQSLNHRLVQQTQVLDRVNDALRKSRVEAEAATQAKAAFLAHMSHEIRTPLNAVIGLSALLSETELNDQQKDFARTINTSGEHLLTVINDILDFSKIEAGKIELETLPIDLSACIEDTLDLVAVRAADKKIELAYFVEPGTPTSLRSDPGRIRQILLNLLSNAVKFTENGEVTVTVNATPLDASHHEWHFAVKDTGPGIPPQVRDKLFRPFEQANASTTRMHGGTGLGLSISAQLVALFGGRVWIESEMGVGSVFHFTLKGETIRHLHESTGQETQSLAGRKILVVDDNSTNRRILSAYIRAWKMEPIEADNPVAALDLLEAGIVVDLAILDYHMPDMDGTQLAQRMRQMPGRETLPLILLSSVLTKQQAGQPNVFRASLMKPIKPRPLYSVVAEILAGPSEPKEHPQTVDQPSELAERHPLNILVAEDNVVNQKVAHLLLGKLGYAPSFAANGLDAVEACAKQSFDVVLMDMQMPVMDGLEATAALLRLYAPGERPRIVAMTANATDEDRKVCINAGMDGYLSKPITVLRLAEVLRSCPQRGSLAHAEATASEALSTRNAPAEGQALSRLKQAFDAGPDELDHLIERIEAETLAMRRCVDRGDAPQGKLHVENLLVAAAHLGFDELNELGGRLVALEGSDFLHQAVGIVAELQVRVEALQSTIATARGGLRIHSDARATIDRGFLARVRRGPVSRGPWPAPEAFVRDSGTLIDKMLNAAGMKDAPTVARIAADLAASCLPFQPTTLLSAARAVESAARVGDLSAVKSLLGAVQEEHQRVKKTLEVA